MNIPQGGIAFFDSGIGGITVLAACRKYVKNDLLYYYGDNTHAPYGNLSPYQIREYVIDVFEYFARLNVKAAVLACNTVTAVCVEELRSAYSFPILGTEPALKIAAQAGGDILVLTTRATHDSTRFQKLCKNVQAIYPQVRFFPVACEQLAGVIERNLSDPRFDYTPFLPVQKADGVVLGCTHYVYIEKQIQNFYRCPVYHGNEGIARQLLKVLKKNRDERPLCIFDRQKVGRMTTNIPPNTLHKGGSNLTNKSSRQNPLQPLKIQGEEGIIFLGESAKKNEEIYKQTYVRGKNGR